MSSFIMHDLKNLTNSLSLVSQNARDNIDNPEFQKDAIRTLDSTVTRMKGLMDKLSALPRELELRKKHVVLKSLVHKAIQKIPVAEGLNLTILNEVGPAESVNVDPDAMDMVVLNLLKNAFEATGPGAG